MVKDNTLSIEWDDAAVSWKEFVRDEKDYYREYMNNPATFRLIGNVKGQFVLDLACGEGYNSRILAKKDARVVGVDFSEKMIELAKQKEMKEKSGISYYISDATDLNEFSTDSFDMVTCFMSLMDIEEYEKAISEVSRVLKTNGRFIFSITHPCFEWGATTEGETIAEWKREKNTSDLREEKALNLEIKRYFGIFRCEVLWTMKRLGNSFQTTSFHRTLTDYFQAMYKNGLLITRLVEPKPTVTGVLKDPSLGKHTRIPHAIVIEAIKKANN